MTSQLGRTLGAVLVAGSLTAALAACGGGDSDSSGSSQGGAPAATSSAASTKGSGDKVTGQRVDLELQDQAENALTRAGISWRADSPARKDGGDELRLPVTGGSVAYDPLAGSVTTEGSGVVSKAGKQVRINGVTVDLDGKKITATVGGKQTTLATLDTAKREVEHTEGPVADVDGIDVTFTKATVDALNGTLGTSLPTSGMTAELELHLTR